MSRIVSSGLLAVTLSLVGATAVFAQSSAPTVHDAWMREPMGNRTTTGAFLIVENSGAKPLAIVSATSDVSDKVELHEMKMANGMMSMSPVKSIAVPANGKAELKPGSYHLMLFDLKKKTVAGDKIKVTLVFDDGSKVTADAEVRKAEMK